MLQAMCGIRQSIECPAGQAFYRIPRQSIECQADQSFYRMPDKNSQAFYRMTEYLRYSCTETILMTHEGPSEFMLAIDSINSNIIANLLRWLILSGREHYFIFPVSFPESSSSTPIRSLRSSDFFCRHHLDWISLRHSVLTKSSVLRLAPASMRTGQPEAGHPRNLYRVGRASSSPAQATG